MRFDTCQTTDCWTWAKDNIVNHWYTIWPWSSDPSYIVIYYIKWVSTSRTHSNTSSWYQVLSPLSTGLFTKAIAQSGAPFSTYIHGVDKGKSRKVALSLAKHFECDLETDLNIVACLEAQSVQAIINAQYLCVEGSYICTYNPWDAVVDTWSDQPFLPDYPDQLVNSGQFNKVPMIIGVNSEEGIYSAGSYIWDPSMFAIFNEYWSFSGPLIVFDTDNATSAQQDKANLVRQFYFGDREASMETIHEVIDVFSDTIFWVGPHR